MSRQRKLTWIEKKQIERTAFDHPFFDVRGRVLSRREANAIIHSAETRKSGVEVVFEACDRIGVPRPSFDDNHESVLDRFKELFSVPAFRRAGIIAVVVILLVVFFAATPVGRAVAESVIHYIATLFDNGAVMVNQSDSDERIIPVNQEPFTGESEVQANPDVEIYINTFDEFTAITGVQPAILPYPYEELKYYYDISDGFLRLRVVYETLKGRIITYQIWNAAELVPTTSTGFMLYDADPSIYYSVEEDGTISVIKIYDDSLFGIIAEDSYTVEEILSLLTDE